MQLYDNKEELKTIDGHTVTEKEYKLICDGLARFLVDWQDGVSCERCPFITEIYNHGKLSKLLARLKRDDEICVCNLFREFPVSGLKCPCHVLGPEKAYAALKRVVEGHCLSNQTIATLWSSRNAPERVTRGTRRQ